MPRFDGTGPQGKGPMTGRKMGKCSNDNSQNDSTPRFGFGRGFFCRKQRGLGRGAGRGFDQLDK